MEILKVYRIATSPPRRQLPCQATGTCTIFCVEEIGSGYTPSTLDLGINCYSSRVYNLRRVLLNSVGRLIEMLRGKSRSRWTNHERIGSQTPTLTAESRIRPSSLDCFWDSRIQTWLLCLLTLLSWPGASAILWFVLLALHIYVSWFLIGLWFPGRYKLSFAI